MESRDVVAPAVRDGCSLEVPSHDGSGTESASSERDERFAQRHGARPGEVTQDVIDPPPRTQTRCRELGWVQLCILMPSLWSRRCICLRCAV